MVLFEVLTRHQLLRLFFVHPAVTVYTRLQLLHVMVLGLVSSILPLALILPGRCSAASVAVTK